jgi:hypothetical protein
MEQATMRHATGAGGPLDVVLKDGPRLRAAYIDGGGFDFDARAYEVSVQLMDGGHLFVPQERIERVTTLAGEELEFGSPVGWWATGRPGVPAALPPGASAPRTGAPVQPAPGGLAGVPAAHRARTAVADPPVGS